MSKQNYDPVTLTLEKIIDGGRAMGTLEDGRRMFVWGGLPDERVVAQPTKRKSSYAEGVVTEVIESSPERITPEEPGSYLSTSPWQLMTFDAEQRYKSALIQDAFALHHITLENAPIVSDNQIYGYRNKVEFSFWFDTDLNKLSLAFFRRGTHGKIPVEGTKLAHSSINSIASKVLHILNKHRIEGRSLKTLLVRCNRQGDIAWQLYVKDEAFPVAILSQLAEEARGEVIYSNPQSPASVITKRLTPAAEPLSDTLQDIPFHYATEGFFQINLPVYEKALIDMKRWVDDAAKPVVDLYSGVGTIGLTIGGAEATLVEVNESAVREMRRNIKELGSDARAVLAASETALEYVTDDKTVVVDPPRAGLHDDVVIRLLEVTPERIIYLSCNPVTQARDVEKLLSSYEIIAHKGYNFFPRTPHIEHLVVLQKRA